MNIRKPVVAGQFYPQQNSLCVEEITECLEARTLPDELPEKIAGGIVPHAGWAFSGAVAAMVFEAIKQQNKKVHTFVIFGAAHSYVSGKPAVYDRGQWQTPVGQIAIDEDLADAVIKTGTAKANMEAHKYEHSIEVQVPFIQHLFAGSKILPVITPPTTESVEVGNAVGKIIAEEKDKTIVCVGSTDLTHYGPRYGFEPMGTGPEGLKWATEVNDKKFIDLALAMDAETILPTAAEHGNACGPGAAAATIAAAKVLGKTKGVLLAHTNSNEAMLKIMGKTSAESVGYAAIVF